MSRRTVDRRGQVVLLAAAALAVSLIPLGVAYLQLGYSDDIGASTDTAPAALAEQTLERSIHELTTGMADEYSWDERREAVTTVRDRLEPTLHTLSTAEIGEGTVYQISYNQTRAQSWDSCPSGPDRQFGSCVSDRGVVVQERAGRTHVIAVAVDIEVTAPQREIAVTTLIERQPV